MLLPENEDASSVDVAGDSHSDVLKITDDRQTTHEAKSTQPIIARQSQIHHKKRRCSRIRSPIELRFPFFGGSSTSSRCTSSTTSGRSRSNAPLTDQKIVESVVFKPSAASETFESRSPTSDSGLRLGQRKRQSLSADNIDESSISTSTHAVSTTVDSGKQSTADFDFDRQSKLTFVGDLDLGVQRHPSTPVRRSMSQGQNDPSGCQLPASKVTPLTCRCRSVSLSVWNGMRCGRSSSIDYDCTGMTSSCSCSCRGLSSFVLGGANDPPYASESYLYHRAASSRRGFGGNYGRRNTVNECSTTTRRQGGHTSASLSFDLDASRGSIDDSDDTVINTSSIGSFNSRVDHISSSPFQSSGRQSPTASRSMPGTLRRYRGKHGTEVDNDAFKTYDQSLLIYLEGRFGSTLTTDTTSTCDEENSGETVTMGMTVSVDTESRDAGPDGAATASMERVAETKQPFAVDDQNELKQSVEPSRLSDRRDPTIEARWSSVVAGIEARREQQRRAGAVFESAVARATAATDKCGLMRGPSPLAAITTTAKKESRRQMNRIRQLTRSEDNLSIFTVTTPIISITTTPEMTSYATSSTILRLYENVSSDEGGSTRRGRDGRDGGDGRRRRRSRHSYRARERRRCSSWQCDRTLDVEDEEDHHIKLLHRAHDKRLSTVSTNTTSATIASGNDVALCVKKADSFDSGIDTKTESLNIQSTANPMPDDVMIVSTLCQLPPETEAPTLADTRDACRIQARRAPLTDDELKFDINASKLIDLMRRLSISQSNDEQINKDKESDDVTHGADHCQSDQAETNTAPTSRGPQHYRGACDIVEFCQTLRAPSTTTAIHYMNGLFDDIERSVTTTTVDEKDPHLATEFTSIVTDQLGDIVAFGHSDDQRTISELKKNVQRLIITKLKTLEEEKSKLATRLAESSENSQKVALTVADRLSDKQLSKYRLYVDELSKVLHLLLMLAGRLARAQHDIIVYQRTAANSDVDRLAEKTLTTKRDELAERFNDAVGLKSGIDRRRKPLDDLLRTILTESEMDDYQRSVEASCRVRLEAQWIEDRLEVGRRQLALFNVEETCSL